MKTRSRKRSALLTVGVLLISLSLACVVWMKKEQRQYALNRQLIEVVDPDEIDKFDTKKAIALVEAGADPNTQLTPTPMPSLVELLNQLLHRSKLSARHYNPTALMIVCCFDRNLTCCSDRDVETMIKAMLLQCKNVNAKDPNGRTALMWASVGGRTDIISLLLQYGAAIDLQDNEGQTALHQAVWEGQNEAAKLLLKFHANLRLKDKHGNTPLHLTTSKHYYPPGTTPDIVHILQQAGATE